jgi:hypothetical protein
VSDLRARLFPEGTLVGASKPPPKGNRARAIDDAFARRLLVLTVVGSIALVVTAVALVFVVRERSAPPVVAPAPSVETVAAPTIVEPTKVAPAPGPTGRLTVEVRPKSTIRVDGTTVGRGHYSGRVRAGSHVIELRSVDGRSLQERIDVEANGAVTFCWDFGANAECTP